jgi:hypothetical protein
MFPHTFGYLQLAGLRRTPMSSLLMILPVSSVCNSFDNYILRLNILADGDVIFLGEGPIENATAGSKFVK